MSARSAIGRTQMGLYGGKALVGCMVRLANNRRKSDPASRMGTEQLVNRFAPEDLPLKDAAKVSCDGVEC